MTTSVPPPRWPAPKPDRPLSTALVTARPPLSRNGRRQRGFVPDVRSAGARRLVRRLHTAVCLLISRPTAHICQPHAEPMRGPIGPGQTEGDGRGRQREGRVGHPRFRKVPARICILAWGLSVFLVWCLRGVGEGRGLGVNEANVWRLDLTPKGFLSKQDIFDLDISVSAASLLHARSAL